MLEIYCGDGKGKTTAAMGLALRCAGCGMRVHIVQFMKGTKTGEIEAIKQIKGITVSRCDKNYGFLINMDDGLKKAIIDCHNKMLWEAEKIIGEVDMLILDEFNSAYEYNLLDRELAKKIIFENCKDREIVLTGRNPKKEFKGIADYISEIKAVKHPYSLGVKARKGVEY